MNLRAINHSKRSINTSIAVGMSRQATELFEANVLRALQSLHLHV